jgi:hypothetical protein
MLKIIFLKSKTANTRMNKIKISTHTPFQPLESVLVGQGVSDNFFDWIKDDKIRSPLQKIVEETREDLEGIKKACKDFGATVYQTTPLEPEQDLFVNKTAIPVPPIQPRDVHLTLDDKVYCSSTEKVWNYINEIVHADCIVNLFELTYKDGRQYNAGDMINGASCYKVGNRIIIPNIVDKTMRQFGIEFFKQKGYDVIETSDPGHSDGCMSVLKPGVLVSLLDIINYEKTFPSWDVLTLEDQSWSRVNEWINFKNKSKGRWWIPGEESNDYLGEFINTWLSKWTGLVEETIFDVNMFSLSEEYVLVNNYNKIVFDYLKKHKIEPIICPMRHRYFWDGGIHCFTLDLQRKGSRENYF